MRVEIRPHVLVVTMKKIIFPFLSLFVCPFFLGGCDLAQPQRKRQDDQLVVQNDQQPEAELPAQPEQEEPEQAEDNTVLVQAAPGMTGKGTNYNTSTNNPMSIITVPVATYFNVKERLVLQQVDHAMNLYKAENDRRPASHEEYMRKIIQENGIRLPPLPEGHEYVYDPGDGLLKVRKPRNTP